MRHCNHRHFALAFSHGLALLTLTACGPSPSVADKQPSAPIHGDLIDSASAPAPAVVAATAPANPPPIAPVSRPVSTAPAPAAVAAATPAAIAEPPKAQPEKIAAATAPDYAVVGFDQLASYNFEVDDTPLTNTAAGKDKANDQIPARVMALDDKKVSIKGFMLPLKVSAGAVTEFLIMKDQSMCCYGTVPKINQWVSVKASGQGVKSIMDQPVSIEGTLHVGAMRENGYLIGIYHMDGDKMIAPEN